MTRATLNSVDCHREAAPRAQRVVQLALRLTGKLNAFHPPGKCRQHNFRLYAGNSLPDTAVDAHAKSDMARCIALDVEAVRVAPPAGGAGWRPGQKAHPLPRRGAVPPPPPPHPRPSDGN